MTGLLKNKVAIVTGASRGIGKAIVERFVAEGAIVIACSNKKNKAQKEYYKTLSKKKNQK